MKQIDDKDGTGVLCEEFSISASDSVNEDVSKANEEEKIGQEDKSDSNAKEDSTIVSSNINDVTDDKCENDLKTVKSLEEPVNCDTLGNDKSNNKCKTPNRNKNGEIVSVTERKFALRPRKSENQNSDDKQKNVAVKRKVERKSISKKNNEKTPNDPPVLENANDNVIKVNSFENMLPPKLLVEESINESALEKPKPNLENQVENVDQIMLPENGESINGNVKKPFSEVIPLKMKETSESETPISSASDNSNGIKIIKKKKRRIDYWRKRRRFRKLENLRFASAKCSENGMIYYDEGSRNTSPSGTESLNGKKRKHSDSSDNSNKKSREFVVPSPSLADINVKAAIPESTTTSETARLSICLCTKKPQVFISGNNISGDLYCQALDCIDNRIVGCCNPIPSQDVGLFRSSEKTSYQMLCNVHQQRILRHNCCPGCGLFCTQGRYFTCNSMHHFHRTCCIEIEGGLIICPHCAEESHPKLVHISIHSVKDPVFLPQQRPPRTFKPAKMSITRNSQPIVVEDVDSDADPFFNLPSSLLTLPSGEQLSSSGLPQSLSRDKLAHLLNIACRSFSAYSKICCSNRYTYKSLYNAAHSGDVEKIIRMMAGGLNPNHVFDEFGKQTSLHVAAANGHLPAVHILLQAQAQINALDAEQNSPLTVAITAKHNDVVKYLIKCGADLLLKSEDGMTPLHIAAKSGNVGACFHILNDTKLPPKYIDYPDDGGWTPMVWASEFNHIDVVKYLMNKGADPLQKDAEQNIALHWAAFGGSIDIVELYLNEGSDINAVNVHGDTPLHIAARQDKYSCVLLLLARGARSDLRNKSGELPRDCSESPESDIYKGITLNMEISALLTRFQERTPRIISNDISRGKERNQIQCVNSVDDENEPTDYVYVSESCFTSKITVDRTITSLQSCTCQDNCTSATCNCATISLKCWYDNDGKLIPDFNYLDPPMIFECNQACQCNRITCRNRVVQNGISCRFQLFRTQGKGWGIKTLNLIPKGTYVCEYIGEIISDCEADHREDDSYLFDLDNRDGETYCIDARRYGNFARFINHMCVPNIMPVHVFVEHQDLRFPRIAFFANRDIMPEEELGYNYGGKFWVIKWKSFTCSCGSEKCMYSEKTIQTTLDNYNKKLQELQEQEENS